MGTITIVHILTGTPFNLPHMTYIHFVHSIKDLPKEVYKFYYTSKVYRLSVDQKVVDHLISRKAQKSVRNKILVEMLLEDKSSILATFECNYKQTR